MTIPTALLLLFGAALAQVQPVSLDPGEDVGSVVPHLERLEDAEGTLALDDVLESERFEPIGQVFLSGGDGQQYWARIAFRSEASESAKWVLPLGFDRATATVIRTDGTRETSKMGWEVPLRGWTHVVSGIPSVQFDLDPGEIVHVYIHVENGTGYAFSADMTPRELGAHQESRRQRDAFTLLFLGVFIALAIYKLFLFVSFRDASYLFYVLFLLTVSVFWATEEGYTLQYVLGMEYWMPPALSFFALTAASVCYALFVRSYLRAWRHAPRLNAALLAVMAAWLGSAVLAVLGYWTVATNIAAFSGLALLLVTVASGVASLRSGFKPAKAYLVAASAFLSAGVVYIVVYLMAPEHHSGAGLVLQASMVVEVVLLARALSLRIRILTSERSEAVAAHKAAEAAKSSLEELNAFKSRMLGIAAHDLRSPLGTIVGYADMIEFETPDRPDIHESTDAIQRVSTRMLALIEDLLGRAALESREMELDWQRVNLCELAKDAVSEFESPARDKSQTLSLESPPRAMVSVDPVRFRAVLDNLISNAVKYTPVGGQIQVSIQSGVGTIQIRVADSGPGFTEEDREGLFQPFQRLSASPTGGESSTGLGLSIVKQIVDLHEGEIYVESEPGAGAAFVVTLTALEPPQNKSGSRQAMIVRPSAGAPRRNRIVASQRRPNELATEH